MLERLASPSHIYNMDYWSNALRRLVPSLESKHKHKSCIRSNDSTADPFRRIRFEEEATIYIFNRDIGLSSIPLHGLPIGMSNTHSIIQKSKLVDENLTRLNRNRDFSYTSTERYILLDQNIDLSEYQAEIRELDEIRQSRLSIPVCNCGNLSTCGGKYDCYCAYNEIECHEWCVCRDKCKISSHSLSSSPSSSSNTTDISNIGGSNASYPSHNYDTSTSLEYYLTSDLKSEDKDSNDWKLHATYLASFFTFSFLAFKSLRDVWSLSEL